MIVFTINESPCTIDVTVDRSKENFHDLFCRSTPEVTRLTGSGRSISTVARGNIQYVLYTTSFGRSHTLRSSSAPNIKAPSAARRLPGNADSPFAGLQDLLNLPAYNAGVEEMPQSSPWRTISIKHSFQSAFALTPAFCLYALDWEPFVNPNFFYREPEIWK